MSPSRAIRRWSIPRSKPGAKEDSRQQNPPGAGVVGADEEVAHRAEWRPQQRPAALKGHDVQPQRVHDARAACSQERTEAALPDAAARRVGRLRGRQAEAPHPAWRAGASGPAFVSTALLPRMAYNNQGFECEAAARRRRCVGLMSTLSHGLTTLAAHRSQKDFRALQSVVMVHGKWGILQTLPCRAVVGRATGVPNVHVASSQRPLSSLDHPMNSPHSVIKVAPRAWVARSAAMWRSSRLLPGGRLGLRSAAAYAVIASEDTARSAAASAVRASIDLRSTALAVMRDCCLQLVLQRIFATLGPVR